MGTDLNAVANLLAAVGPWPPALPGARCRGHGRLFDAAIPDEPSEVTEQRHAQALTLCRSCPALASCAAWFDGLPRPKRPTGVVAGKSRTGKRGRPPRPITQPK